MNPAEASSPRDSAEDLYARLVESSTTVSQERLEELCSRHPELAADLRALHALHTLLDDVAGGSLATVGIVGEGWREPPPPLEGFDFLRVLGHGGMGVVWEALDRRLGRRVAVKLLPPFASSPRERERFRREALSSARLRHPNVVAVYSTGDCGERLYLVQELVEGGRTLRDELEELRRSGMLPKGYEGLVARRFAQLADALARAHEHGIVHRDVKPANVLVEPDGTPKLADFGLAKATGDVSLSRTGEFVGTYPYASPEQVSGAPVGPASDVFSLGATLYEALTLTRPFAGDEPTAIVRQILTADPVDPRQLRPRIPRDLAVITLRALERKPESRYASMADLRDDLLRHAAGEPIRARPPSLARRLQRAVLRHPTVATASVLGSGAWVAIVLLWAGTERAREATELANERLSEINTALDAARITSEAEAETTAQVLRFLSELFRSADPLRHGTEDATLADIVRAGADRMRTTEFTEPRVRVRLLNELGPLLSRLGHWDEATEMLQEAVALWERLGEGDSLPAIEARVSLAVAHSDQGRTAQCRALLEPLLTRARQPGVLPAASRIVILSILGFQLGEAGETARGEELLREALELAPEVPDERPLVQATEASLVTCLLRQGRVSEAAQHIEPLCDELSPSLAAGYPTALDAFNLRGKVRFEQGRVTEALDDYLACLRAAEERLGRSHPRCVNLRNNVGTCYIRLQRWPEAEDQLRAAIATCIEGSQEELSALGNLGTVLIATGRSAEAEETLRRVLDQELDAHGEAHLRTALARSNLAICLYYLGRPAEAIELQQAALDSIGGDLAERRDMENALEIYRRAAQ